MDVIEAALRQGLSIVITYLDFKNAFNSVDVLACLTILRHFNVPNVDLLERIYRGAYYQARMVNGRFTAQIPLTRGTKQGDPLSPLIFNLTINILFRMLAQSGHAFTANLSLGLCRTIKRSLNSKGFADDTTLVTHNVMSTNILLNVVQSFCAYTGMQVRHEKCEVTGFDFGTNKPMDVSGVRFEGKSLPSLAHKDSARYLGIHVSLSLNWATEKRYVMAKMYHAIEQLRNTCFTRAQLLMLFRVCVIPIFRYSAPLVPWTQKELHSIDRLWSKAIKYALRLPVSFDLAPVLLDKVVGGF